MNKINKEKMSELGKEFVELALKIEDLKKQQTHNKNVVKVIPGGRYAQCPTKELEQEIGHRTSQLPLSAQRALVSLWEKNYGLPNFQNWYIEQTHKNPQDRAALNKLWRELCFMVIPWYIRTALRDCQVDEFTYGLIGNGSYQFGRRNRQELEEFRVSILRRDSVFA